MTLPWSTPGTERPELSNGPPSHRTAPQTSGGHAPGRPSYRCAGPILDGGPTTLLAELRLDHRWADHLLPSRSRIAALLSAEKLTRHYEKHCDLPTPTIQPEGAPHDEWELDAASVAWTWQE